MHIPFQLNLRLLTPFYCPHRLTLDGLLSAAVHNATGLMGEATIPHIPLAQEDGVFHGSSMFCHPMYRHAVVERVMSLKTERDLSINLIAPKKGKYSYIDQQRGPYKANMSAYPGIASPEVYFWGVGDPDRVVQLLENYILGIGKRAGGGAGEIIGIGWTETHIDQSWMTSRQKPARPLPVAHWERLGGTLQQVAPLAVSLPYWAAPKQDCVFPESLTV